MSPQPILKCNGNHNRNHVINRRCKWTLRAVQNEGHRRIQLTSLRGCNSRVSDDVGTHLQFLLSHQYKNCSQITTFVVIYTSQTMRSIGFHSIVTFKKVSFKHNSYNNHFGLN